MTEFLSVELLGVETKKSKIWRRVAKPSKLRCGFGMRTGIVKTHEYFLHHGRRPYFGNDWGPEGVIYYTGAWKRSIVVAASGKEVD